MEEVEISLSEVNIPNLSLLLDLIHAKKLGVVVVVVVGGGGGG